MVEKISNTRLKSPEKVQALENTDNHFNPISFAEDDSKNPPAKSILDRLTRRFSRPAYVIVVLLLYLACFDRIRFGISSCTLFL